MSVCRHCGDEVKPDRKGYLWAADQNDGQPLWCDPSPDKRHEVGIEAGVIVAGDRITAQTVRLFPDHRTDQEEVSPA